MFYIARLFIYNTEAEEKPEPERGILRRQYTLMIRRLWFGITWPSAVLTLIFGSSLWYSMSSTPDWLVLKLIFVAALFAYHFSLHHLYNAQRQERFKYSSQQLRIWNEVATVFLVAIVMLVVVKQQMSLVWGLAGLAGLIIILMSAISIYRRLRK